MKNITKIVAAIVSAVTIVASIPQVNAYVAAFLMAHSEIGVIVGGIATLFALFHSPDASGGQTIPR